MVQMCIRDSLIGDRQPAGVAAGGLDGFFQGELALRHIIAGGILAQAAKGHLKLTDIQHLVFPEVPETPLPRNCEGAAKTTLAVNPDSFGACLLYTSHIMDWALTHMLVP